jgi:predicted deacetylase
MLAVVAVRAGEQATTLWVVAAQDFRGLAATALGSLMARLGRIMVSQGTGQTCLSKALVVVVVALQRLAARLFLVPVAAALVARHQEMTEVLAVHPVTSLAALLD